MVFAVEFRRVLEACLAITFSVLVLNTYNPIQSNSRLSRVTNGLHVAVPAVQNLATGIGKRVAVPFGQRYTEEPFGLTHLVKKEPTPNSKRADPNALTLDQAIKNGNKYLGIIEAAKPKPAVWTQADFDVGGWEDKPDLPQNINDALRTVMEALKISTNAADIHKTETHQFKTGFENMDCEIVEDVSPTINPLANTSKSYFPTSGAIIVHQVTSPQAENLQLLRQHEHAPTDGKRTPQIDSPDSTAGPTLPGSSRPKQPVMERANLRYIFRENIINKNTKAVIDQVFKVPANTLDLKIAPGRQFDVRTSDEGKALLGSPQGSGIA
ncbi:MAG: hypothetical protein Q9224_007168, partial [Gallowayella concinna]